MKKIIILTVIFLLLTPKYALSSFSCYLDFDKCLQKADSGDVESQHKVAKYFMGVTGKKISILLKLLYGFKKLQNKAMPLLNMC